MIRSLDGNKPKIHPSVFVSEAAYIVGDGELGECSSITHHYCPGGLTRMRSAFMPVGLREPFGV